MKEAFEKIRKKMKEQTEFLSDCTKYGNKDAKQQEKSYSTMYMYEIADMVDDLIDVVSEVEAEYGNRCEKHTYEICLNGCDDDTNFEMELTESEYQFLLRVSELANKTSTYGCMPRMYVEPYMPTND